MYTVMNTVTYAVINTVTNAVMNPDTNFVMITIKDPVTNPALKTVMNQESHLLTTSGLVSRLIG